VRLTRVYRFSASHRLHAPSLDEQQNQDLYGKCNNPFGHGHNYTVHVSVAGDPAVNTGRVVNIGDLDRYVSDCVVHVFDNRDINVDVPDFNGVPTTENLAIDIAQRLKKNWNARINGAKLDRVFIEETPRNKFELRIG